MVIDGDGGDGDDDKENGVFEMFRTGWNKCFCLLAKTFPAANLKLGIATIP